MDSETLRICLLTYRGNPTCGGQGVYIKYLSRALRDLGHHVDVISGPPYPELADNITLIKKNPNKSFPLYETTPGKIVNVTGKDSYFDKGFSFYTQGGPMPGIATMKSLKFTDIIYVDRENMEIKLKVSPQRGSGY